MCTVSLCILLLACTNAMLVVMLLLLCNAALFSEIDADGSGQLDEDEFGNLLTSMGMYIV